MLLHPNIFLAIFIVLVASLFSLLVFKFFKIELKPVKHETINGLRGYLAFFVFLHHACIYYYFMPNYSWSLPPHNLFIHFGQTAVSFFFMITGFLFFEKLINAKQKKIDWIHYFVSRLMRLYPLYLFVLLLVCIAIAFTANFSRYVDFIVLFNQLNEWLLFALFNKPPINNFDEVDTMTAGVLWSLKYEWLFYLSLPVMGLVFFKQRPTLLTLIISSYIFYLIYNSGMQMVLFNNFIYGLAAAIVVRYSSVCNVLKHWLFSVLIVVLICSLVIFYNTSQAFLPQLFVGISFIIIATGNSIFGLLTLKASKALGQLAYSIYLLHGFVLYVFFRFFLREETFSKLSFVEFWTIITGLAIVIISLSYFAYYKIELPCINYTKKIIIKFNGLRAKINSIYFNN